MAQHIVNFLNNFAFFKKYIEDTTIVRACPPNLRYKNKHKLGRNKNGCWANNRAKDNHFLKSC